MNPTSINAIAEMCGGQVTSGLPEVQITRVVTDSRRIQPGDLFIALRGDRFDAHHFIPQAVSQGAGAIMSEQEVSVNVPLIKVTDTLLGLQTLARVYRAQLKCHTIGITGSNGKTTAKDICAALLSSRFSVSKTEGNLNNHIGLPLSVLALDHSHDVAILEMGMNHAGEIAPLATIAAPNVGIVTNIGVAHIEYLKSQEAIAIEKSALVEAVSPDGLVILNANDSFTPLISSKSRARIITAGILKGDISASNLIAEETGSRFSVTWKNETASAFLPIPGLHMISNAVLAIAAAVSHGISLSDCIESLKNVTFTAGRLEVKNIQDICFLDDSYNANPDSMVAALATLENMPTGRRRIAVLGAMGELGSYSEEGHRKVGKAARRIDLLITVGKTADWIADEAEKEGAPLIIRTANTTQAVAALLDFVTGGDCVLVKGSRSAGMEKVIQEIAVKLQPATSPA